MGIANTKYKPKGDILNLVTGKWESPIAETSKSNGKCTPENVRAEAQRARSLGAEVCITGHWAWAKWKSPPPQAAITTLKSNGWVWCHHKGKWAYRGKPAHSKQSMDWGYIVRKYGYIEIKGDSDDIQ